MDVKEVIATLHPLERKVLPHLKAAKSVQELATASGLQEVEVMRALQWLQNKEILTIKKEEQEVLDLDKNGKTYATKLLPELRLLEEVKDKPKNMKDLSLPKEEVGIALGELKKRAAITFDKGSITITDVGKQLREKQTLEQKFLQSSFPKTRSQLKPEEVEAAKQLAKRKNMLTLTKQKTFTFTVTTKGKSLSKKEIKADDVIDRLTPDMLKTGSWKKKSFRRYDLQASVPRISSGRRHFTKGALDYARRVWMDMGFKEMTGSKVQTSFWTFDALFTPQDHPVREMQDTFFLKTVPKGKLPDKKIVSAVKKAHEGGIDGSEGWGSTWDESVAATNVLRTHTTALSAKTLSEVTSFPAKYFAIGKCFRNEAVDWSHLFEFNQTEGIVIDKNVNFRHLLGYLKQFFAKMGYPKARFRPAFFSYTEPSVEIDVFHPKHKKWIEFGGAGMLRPEVTIPLLGEDISVLAWGPGIDRVIVDYFGIKDLRDLYKNDIALLRSVQEWKE